MNIAIIPSRQCDDGTLCSICCFTTAKERYLTSAGQGAYVIKIASRTHIDILSSRIPRCTSLGEAITRSITLIRATAFRVVMFVWTLKVLRIHANEI
jgi:hypothetical protein